jgi:predicted O-methyltransferase YrrM
VAAGGTRVADRLRSIVDHLINLEIDFHRPLRRISFADLARLLGGAPADVRLLFGNRYGNVSLLESLALAYLARASRAETVFEIGTYDGFSTYHLARNTGETARVYTLNLPLEGRTAGDLPQYSLLEHHGDATTDAELARRGLGAVYRASDAAGKVTQLLGDSLTYDFAPYAGKVDLVFIDGGHSYRHVRSDTENALRMLSPHGIIVWHDFNTQHRDIYRYLATLAATRPLYHLADTRLAIHLNAPGP